MAAPQRIYTPAEYLELERAAEFRSEYVYGQIYAMSGATDAHTHIAGNAFAALHTVFRGRACRVWTADMRVQVRATGMYTYPDIAALCGQPAFEDRRTDILLNPSVVIEVLSPSTEDYDRGDKFAHYRRLASLHEYVLIAQDRVHVERYVREGDGWVLSEFTRLTDVVTLPSVDTTLALRDAYEGVEFPPIQRPRVVRDVPDLAPANA